MNEQIVYILRIVLAGICGIIIGMERKNRSKEAGVRTHFIVACGAALIMIVSKYAFYDMIQGGISGSAEVRLDPSRVASTIASGIGFLGAGMIFVHKNTVTGLTTAAGIWATSGVGMAVGAGMYGVGVGATIIILTAQFILHLNFSRNKNDNVKILSVKDVTEKNFQRVLSEKLSDKNITILNVSIDNTNMENGKNYMFKIEMPNSLNEDEIIDLISYKSSIKTIQ